MDVGQKEVCVRNYRQGRKMFFFFNFLLEYSGFKILIVILTVWYEWSLLKPLGSSSKKCILFSVLTMRLVFKTMFFFRLA